MARETPTGPDIRDTPPRLRNPDLAPPAPRTARPRATALPGGSVASNGYWLHDAAGPRHVAAPATDPGLVDLIAAIAERLAGLEDLDASRVEFSLEGQVLRLIGSVADHRSRRRVGACAMAVISALPEGPRLENRLRIAPGGQDDG